MESNWTYFQYFKDLELPVYVRCDLSMFDASLESFLIDMKFEQLDEKAVGEASALLKTSRVAKVLTLTEATTQVSRQIESATESDRYGEESIVPKKGYSVYRYKSNSLMVYSHGATEWQLGCYSDFGSTGCLDESRATMNRFLSWALAPMGIVGFWGVPVDQGVVLLRRKEAAGEAIFIDVVKRKILSLDGHNKMSARFTIMKLDNTLTGKNIRLSIDELHSSLAVACTYFSYSGLSVGVRQMIQSLTKSCEGVLHPRESFKPRTDLSL